jgi:hypothetical protein
MSNVKALLTYSREELEDLLIKTSIEMQTLRAQLPLLGTDAAIFDSQYRQKKAACFFASSEEIKKETGIEKITEGARDAYVDMLCTEEREKAHVATNIYGAASQQLKALQSEITVYQTLLGMQKKEMDFTNTDDAASRSYKKER